MFQKRIHFLAKQVMGSVRWEESIRKMADDGTTAFIEVGPGWVLQGLITRIIKHAYVMSVGDPCTVEELKSE